MQNINRFFWVFLLGLFLNAQGALRAKDLNGCTYDPITKLLFISQTKSDASGEKNVVRCMQEDGTPLWESVTEYPVDVMRSNPITKTLACASKKGQIYLIDEDEGKMIWEEPFELKGEVIALCFGSTEERLFCLLKNERLCCINTQLMVFEWIRKVTLPDFCSKVSLECYQSPDASFTIILCGGKQGINGFFEGGTHFLRYVFEGGVFQFIVDPILEQLVLIDQEGAVLALSLKILGKKLWEYKACCEKITSFVYDFEESQVFCVTDKGAVVGIDASTSFFDWLWSRKLWERSLGLKECTLLCCDETQKKIFCQIKEKFCWLDVAHPSAAYYRKIAL